MLDRKAHSLSDEYMGNERVPLAANNPKAIVESYKGYPIKISVCEENREKFEDILGIPIKTNITELKLTRGISLLVGEMQSNGDIEWWLL